MKKILSIILALTLAITSLGIGTAAFAEEAKTATIEYSVYDQGVFTLTPTKLTVSSELSNKYAEQVGYNDKSSEPTILDAIIAAHLYMFGDSFMDYAPLNVTPNGWITSSFGEETSNSSYRLNGATDDGKGNYYNLETAIKNNDYIEYMFYIDCTGFSDVYVSFDARNKSVKLGDDITLTAYAEGYDAKYNIVKAPASDLTITSNDEVVGTTDKDGKITLKANMIGEQIISATGKIGTADIFAPYCKITVSTDIQSYVDSEIEAIAKVLVPSVTEYNVNNAVTFLNYIKSGYDMGKYKDAFIKSVKDTLDKNGGKLPNTESYGYNYTMGMYAAVIQILDYFDCNPSKFNGINLVEQFNALELGKVKYQPYYYRVAIETAVSCKSYDFASDLADDLISTYYTVGKGMNYYGYSCDNTAMFITALSYVSSGYKYYINDAKKLLKGYETDEGFCYTADSKANADSTAYALMAYSSLYEIDRAFDVYQKLVKSFEGKTGSLACVF